MGAIQVSEDNFGLANLNRGILTTSWDAREPMSVSSDKVLFTLVFKSVKTVKSENSFEITSDVTVAEAYNVQGETNVTLDVRSNEKVVAATVFELLQKNTPNPFESYTNISFRLPVASAATLTIYDVTGKVHRVVSIQGQKDWNTVTLSKSS